MPAVNAAHFGDTLRAVLPDVLRDIGVSRVSIEAELQHMAEVTVSTTNDRHVVGAMIEFCFMLDAHIKHGDTPGVAQRRLVEMPCSALGINFPGEMARALLDDGVRQLH